MSIQIRQDQQGWSGCIELQKILMEAGNHLAHAVEWQPMLMSGSNSTTFESLLMAKSLIELVEVYDCGSIGGFGKRQDTEKMNSLFARWHWLCMKYWPEVKDCKNEGNGEAYFDYIVLKRSFAMEHSR